MDKWDKTYKKHEIIQKYPIENGMEKQIVYLYIKMPVFMTDREVVLEEKIWSEYNGNPQNFFKCQRSTTNSKYPVKRKAYKSRNDYWRNVSKRTITSRNINICY